MSFRPIWLLWCIATLVSICFGQVARADYLTAVGWYDLQAELGASMPNGSGVAIAQIEIEQGGSGTAAYAAHAGTGTYPGTGSLVGKTFTAKSAGGVAAYAYHAEQVCLQFCGTNAALGRFGMGNGVTQIDAYEANDYLNTTMLRLAGGQEPFVQNRKIENHSWIAAHNSGTATTFDLILKRHDYVVDRDDVLAVCGSTNGDSPDVPALMVSSYNSLSVGLTNGNHGHGFTVSSYGGGRVKPEIVAPENATSYAVPMVGAAGSLLRQSATTANGRANETLRAILLAGATKEEFPNWSRTSTRPLDSTFGAGELNVYHSYHILKGGEQAVSATLPPRGWDFHAMTVGGTADYFINVPAPAHIVGLSVVLVWNRKISDAAGPGWSPVATVPNFSLHLYRLPGTPGTLVDSSVSTVGNLEHLWFPNLCEGNYRLRVTNISTAADYAIAWRMATATPTITAQVSGGNIQLSLANLRTGQAYLLQRSTDLAHWSTAHSFTATGTSSSWSTAQTQAREFYRLSWNCP